MSPLEKPLHLKEIILACQSYVLDLIFSEKYRQDLASAL